MSAAYAFGHGCQIDCPPPPSGFAFLIGLALLVFVAYAFYRFIGWLLK